MKRDMMNINGKQKGFTMVEFAIAILISAILVGGISVFSVQSIRESQRSYNHTKAIQQLENTGFWISLDIQKAQDITLGPNAGFPLQVTWEDESGNKFETTFDISGSNIQRIVSENGEPPSQTTLTQSINPSTSLTNCTYTNKLLILNLTATVGNYSLSRTYQIKKRTGDF